MDNEEVVQCEGQMEIPFDREDIRKLVRSHLSTLETCHHTIQDGCRGHGDF